MRRVLDRINGYLRHDTTTGIQLREMDAFRGWAVLGVLMLHSSNNMGDWDAIQAGYGAIGEALMFVIKQGWAGVDLFFFISGFLLFLKFGKAYYRGEPAPSRASFYLRRFKRIAPAYYANMALLLIFGGGWLVAPVLKGVTLPNIASHVFFVFNLFPAHNRTINYIYWTLAIEAQFYLVLPFIAGWFCGKRWVFGLPAVLVASGAYKLLATGLYVPPEGVTWFNLANSPFNQLMWRIDEFAIGICFANLWLYLQNGNGRLSFPANRRNADLMVLAGLVLPLPLLAGRMYGWVGMYSYYIPQPLVLCLSFGLVVTGTLYASSPIKRVIANPAIEFLGIISYSVYLWHFVIIKTLSLHFPGLGEQGLIPLFSLTGLALAVTVTISLASYLLFERPFLKRRRPG